MGEVYSHLSGKEHQVIQIKVGSGAGIRGIDTMLDRSPPSISREIKRNIWLPSNENESYRPYRPRRLKAGPWTGRYYIAGPVQRKADRRRSKPRKPYRLSHDRLWAQVTEWLGRGQSPLLISGRLRVLWPDDALMRVCPETIYRWAYSSRPLRERWARCLLRGHRRRHRHDGRRTSRFPIPGRVPVSERPPGVDGRSAFGHWEADNVIGVGCNPRTEVEKRTRFLTARIIPDKTAGESVGAQLDMFLPLPAGACVSVTHDNGIEFAHHERLRDGLGVATYFADPYSSWQRGNNKNRSGMIRRYLPKRCEIRMDMAKEVREIVDEINNRPMRALGYRTPAEAFADELLGLQDQQGCYTSKQTSGSIGGLFAGEKMDMQSLPVKPYDAIRWEVRKANKDGRVQIDGNYYLTGPSWCGQTLDVGLRAFDVMIRTQDGRTCTGLPRVYGDSPATVRNLATPLFALSRKTHTWTDSTIRDDFPDKLRITVDRMDAKTHRTTFRITAKASAASGFEAAVRAGEHLVEQGHAIDEASVTIMARRITTGEKPYEQLAPDLTRYDVFMKPRQPWERKEA